MVTMTAVATTLAVSLVCLLVLFDSFCQMAPAVAGAIRGWETGSGLKYQFTTTLLFREVDSLGTGSADVGFRLTGELDVLAVWRDPRDHDSFLLKLELLSPQLWIKSRKAPKPEGFVEHSSKVDDATREPFSILWRNGEIRSLYLHSSESVSSANLKRGLASVFQYRTLDDELQETDASGFCNVTYSSLSPKTMEKRKTFCTTKGFPRRDHPNPIFGVNLFSRRNSSYEFTQSLLPRTVRQQETHRMSLPARPEVGTSVFSETSLTLIPGSVGGKTMTANTPEDAVNLLNGALRKSDLRLDLEEVSCSDTGCPTPEESLEDNRDALESSVLGTAKSATAFLKTIPSIEKASSEELAKLLKSPRNRYVKPQLLDLYGFCATSSCHKAAMKILRQDDTGDETERYLWAVSMSPNPSLEIVEDVLRRSEETIRNEKVSETLALTAAAMARTLGTKEAMEKTRLSLELGLESCTGEECKLKFLRALRNLRSPLALRTLLRYATANSEQRSVTVAAWRAICNLPKHFRLDAETRNRAIRVFYQLDRRRESSARTLALDVILERDPSRTELRDLVRYLSRNDTAYEIRKYLSQRLAQLAERDRVFGERLREVIAELRSYNYHVLAQRGLSTAFTRIFLSSPDNRGSLVTVQEVKSGLLKRGTVDVVFATKDQEDVLFSLGLFAKGLSGFVSSDGKEEEEEEEEEEGDEDDIDGVAHADADADAYVYNDDSEEERQRRRRQRQDEEIAMAGMEIDVLGVGIRPFVFFSGQGELMGHVWSGTASQRTPAFQALIGLHNFQRFVPLGSGFVAEIEARGAVSFDLAGQIQLSLWSRNAHSLVEVNAGVVVQGGTKVRSSIVQSTAEFSMTTEPKLQLATDVDFAGPVSLCMRLTQPETAIKRWIYKVERISGSRHKLRKTRRISIHSPGKSYMLNRKNNEMCSKTFS